ncbi:Mur ligase middle domain protein, partial [Ostertagia ostertagi]
MAGNVSEWCLDTYRPITSDLESFRPFRGNVYETYKRVAEDNSLEDKDSLGHLPTRPLTEQELAANNRYETRTNDVRNFGDGDSLSTFTYGYGKTSLINDETKTDTRKLAEGDLFFALTGPSFNGNAFAAAALKQGAAYAVIDDSTYQTDERCILVNDVLGTLQALALHHRQQLNIPFIAITGSNGKTTTKELILSVLQQQFNTYATAGNLNNHIGVPLTILGIKQDAEMAIIEMGANHLHEIESYCRIALPDYGLITNCGKAHIEGFGSLEGIRKGKGKFPEYHKTDGNGDQPEPGQDKLTK